MINTVKIILERDLTKLKTEIAAFKKEENIWRVDGAIANSAGNLCLHLIGNLNTYIGIQLGGTQYIRQRELEFSLKNVPRADLLRMIDETIEMLRMSLEKLNDQDLQKEFPMQVFENKTTIEYMLVHLATHLGYHLGQINYHRRLLDI
jgi:uncharacterized damage-inducible protein DinB